jgi:hypothetical protein
MTYHVMAFRDGTGRDFCALVHLVAPNAYGGGGSPLNCNYTLFVNGAGTPVFIGFYGAHSPKWRA